MSARRKGSAISWKRFLGRAGRVPLDKVEGVVKAYLSWAVREHRWFASQVEDQEHTGELAIDQTTVELHSFHQPSIRPTPATMILLCEPPVAYGRRERPINSSVYPPWRTTRGTRGLLSMRTISGYGVCVRSIQ